MKRPGMIGGKRGRHFRWKIYEERIAHGRGTQEFIPRHEERYNFCVRTGYIDDKRVLDAGCGTGYGSNILAQRAKKVTAVDISPEALEFANKRWKRDNIDFVEMDLLDLKFPDESFERIVALESFEHVPDPEKMLSELHRVLEQDGILIISSPNRYMLSPFVRTPYNPYHIREFTIPEFRAVLQKHFKVLEMHGQETYPTWASQQAERFRVMLRHTGIADIFQRKRKKTAPELHPKEVVKKIPEKGNHQPCVIFAICKKE